MADRLKDKVALVTGASRGIGRAAAAALAGEGAQVVMTARDRGRLETAAAAIGGQTTVAAADLSDEAAVLDLAAGITERLGRLDILVNNAGITLSAPLEATSALDWDRLMAVNARAPFLLCRQLLPLLKASPAGRIINISSVVGVKGYPLQSAYTASKHALRGMSIALAEELRDTPVRVHVICPGGVDTDMVGRVRPDIPKEDLIAPEEIAEMVLYLCTHTGNAVIDELRPRRHTSGPWF